MKEPVRAAEIVAAVAKASHVPVTVKMRLGFEAGSETYLLLGQLVQEERRADDYAARAHQKPVLRRPRRLERHREAQAARVHPRGRQWRRDLLAGRAADDARRRAATAWRSAARRRATRGFSGRFADAMAGRRPLSSRRTRRSLTCSGGTCMRLRSSRARRSPCARCGGTSSAMCAGCATRRGCASG